MISRTRSQHTSAAETPILSASNAHSAPACLFIRRRTGAALAWIGVVALSLAVVCPAQNASPFAVSNPRHQKLPIEEASRIYDSACTLVARAIRPEQPPHLQPKFTLVLGAQNDEIVRDGGGSEVHLKAWNSANFAQAVVMLASREILKTDDVRDLVRAAVLSARASVSVSELGQKQ